jgi:alkylation response protein AidB-like acyl-CoA dehydrogenase
VDFGDTPDDAAYRAKCRAWLEANASRRVDARGLGALVEADHEAEERHVRAAMAWQATLERAGWAGIAWPREFGGSGGTARQQAIFNAEEADFDVPATVFAQAIGMAGPTIIDHGSDEQKDRFLRPMLRGEEIWCQLFSEPGAGSDLASIATRAVRDGDEFVVNGQKVWTSSAQVSDWAMLLARTNPEAPKHKGITYFLVDMRSPGIDVRPLYQITGVAHFSEVFLTDVRIPAANVVGAVDDGWRGAMTTLTNERTMIGGVEQGDIVGSLIALATRAGRWDEPALRQQLMRALTNQRILTYLGWRAQTTVDKGRVPDAESSVLKLAHSVHQAELGEVAMAVLGAAGMTLDYRTLDDSPWQTRFLAQWASRFGGGTEQVQRNIIGERVLGLPREARPDKDLPFRSPGAGSTLPARPG